MITPPNVEGIEMSFWTQIVYILIPLIYNDSQIEVTSTSILYRRDVLVQSITAALMAVSFIPLPTNMCIHT